MKSMHSSLSAGALLLTLIVMAVLTTYFTPQPPNAAPVSAPLWEFSADLAFVHVGPNSKATPSRHRGSQAHPILYCQTDH
jgi:hypothetical protein